MKSLISEKLSFFTFAWALIHLLDKSRNQTANEDFWSTQSFIRVCLLLAVGYALGKPSNKYALPILSIMSIADALVNYPEINNHNVIMAFISTGIVFGWIFNLAKYKKLKIDWFENLKPFLRLLFIISYASAAISKLNNGFFDHNISCANALFKVGYGSLFGLNHLNLNWLPIAVALTENFIWIGLVFAKTRNYAIIIAIVFHTLLTLPSVLPGAAFTLLLLVLLTLFLPESATLNLMKIFYSNIDRIKSRISKETLEIIAPTAILASIIVVGLGYSIGNWLPQTIIGSVFAGILIYVTIRWRKEKIEERMFSLGPKYFGVFLVANLLLNNLSPYIGGKTLLSMTMYSNLQTEGENSNHFFIPRISVFSGQDDLVQIVNSTDSDLNIYSQNQAKLVYLDFLKIIKNFPDAGITYKRSGEVYNIEQISNISDLKTTPHWKFKWLPYRTVDSRCSW